MNYHRYGKFRLSDYTSAWFASTFMFVLVVVGLLMDEKIHLLVWPLIMSVVVVWSVLRPNMECFTLADDRIIVKKDRKRKEIDIPPALTLIVSYADVCPPIAKRIGSIGNQTYLLKGRYAISILQKMALEDALERLHQKNVRKYTMSTIESFFDDHSYIYSFVCEQSLFDKLIGNRECQLIIPESLLDKLFVDPSAVNVHIDTGY